MPEEQTPAMPAEPEAPQAPAEPAIPEVPEDYTKLQAQAKEAGFDNVSDYVETLYDLAYQKEQEAAKPAPAPKPVAPAKPPDPPGMDQKFIDQLNNAERLAFRSHLDAQWAEYQLQQRDLPQDQRSGLTKADAFKMIQGPQAKLIEQLAPQHGDNYFGAIAYLKDVDAYRGMTAEQRKEFTQRTVEAAAESGTLPKGGRLADPSAAPTPAEAAAQENKKRADAIAPPDTYVYPGDS